MRVEIELDNPRNKHPQFAPLASERLRGRFELLRDPDRNAGQLRNEVPAAIEGMHLAVDLDTSTGFLIEPLHDCDAETATWLAKFLKQNRQRLRARETSYPGIDTQQWLYFMSCLVRLGKARLIAGEFPPINYRPPTDPNAPLVKRGAERKAEIFTKHPDVAAQYATWNEKQRREWESLVGV